MSIAAELICVKNADVMRYSGPGMIFHHPLGAVSHVIANRKETIRFFFLTYKLVNIYTFLMAD